MTQAQSVLRRMLTSGLLAAVLAFAATQARGEDVTVRGSGTCQEYLDAKNSHSIPEAVKHLTWLLGYVSGLAVATHVNILGKSDAESLVNWVDAYCDRYPARYISDAGDLYYRFRVEQMKTASYPK